VTWNRRLYFPCEGRHAEDFFALKNPAALAVFEPANLGTKGQHATSRPLKPLALVDGRFTMSSESVCQVARSWVDVGSFHTHLAVRFMIFTASVRNVLDTPSQICLILGEDGMSRLPLESTQLCAS
jgi:hypothetical protein